MNTETLIKELYNFIEELRLAGYHIGATQLIAAQDVILALTAQDKLPTDLTQLKTLLAPILCHSPTEQKEFQHHFEQWINQIKISVAPKTTSFLKEIQESKSQENKKGIQLWKWGMVFAVVVLISSILLVYWKNITSFIQDETTTTPKVTQVGITPLDETVQPETTQPEDIPSKLELIQPNTTKQLETKSSFEEFIRWYIWIILFVSVLSLLIFILFLWHFWLRYYVPHFLVKKSTFVLPDIKRLFVEGIDDKLFQTANLLQTAQQLQKHTSISSFRLDITATIEKTIKAADWFTPIISTVTSRPEYLVLIDRMTFKDHQTELVNALINKLINEGVLMTRYYFETEPRHCYPEEIQQAPITLTELAAYYPKHCLMIFSDGTDFINPITGEIAAWIEQLSGWTQRIFFSLETPEKWGYREELLEHHNFLVIPANEKGLNALVERINTGFWQPYFQPPTVSPVEFPKYLMQRPRRWLDRYGHAPNPTVQTELLTQIRHFLGEDGYYWLSACAFYPELHWQLTLYLGHNLKSADGKPLLTEVRLAKLARLPWFRYGYMPNWLRERLIEDLPAYQRKEVDIILNNLLLTALNKPLSDFNLEIAQTQKAKLANYFKRWRVFSKWAKRIPERNSLHDYSMF